MKGNSTLRLWWPRRAASYGWGFFVPPSKHLAVGHPRSSHDGMISIPR